MHAVFQILNGGGDEILGDEYGNDVSILEDGTAKFKTIQISTITPAVANTDLTLSGNGSGVIKLDSHLNANSKNITGVNSIALNNATFSNITASKHLHLQAGANSNISISSPSGSINLTPSFDVGVSGILNMLSNKIIGLALPADETDAASKKYVDDTKAALSGASFTGAVFMGSNKLSGQLISRPWCSLTLTSAKTTQGFLPWDSLQNNPDFNSYYSSNMHYITFPEVGYYRITASATFQCTDSTAPERRAFIQFRTLSTLLAAASDQILTADSGDVFGNAGFNRIVHITSTSNVQYYFNWGTFSHDVGTLTADSHASIERVA